jgi:large subunit ribosomal protein L16
MTFLKFTPVYKNNKNVKFQKKLLIPHKNSYCKKNIDLSSGTYGCKVMDSFQITPQQLETSRLLFKKIYSLRKKGFFKINVFPLFSKTKKSTGVRMGKGKGSLDSWVYPVEKGRIIFEFQGLKKTKILFILKLLKKKLPVNLKLIEQ